MLIANATMHRTCLRRNRCDTILSNAIARVCWLLVLLVTSCHLACGDDWPHWRGPQRNDVVAETSGWNDGKWLNESAWQTQVGQGSTSPLVIGDRLYTLGWHNGRDHVVCLDVTTGKQHWSVSYACPLYGRKANGDQGIYSGPSSTPEFDSQKGFLITLSTDGDLNCWDTRQNGRHVWGFNLYERYDPPQRPRVGRSGQRDYGFTSSPLVQNETVIVEVGAAEGTLMAFDLATGKRRWTSQAGSPAGHNGGPVPILVEGIPCVAVHHFDGLLVSRIDSGHEGETIATYPWKTDFANNIATIAVHDNSVVMTSAYNQHSIARLSISRQGVAKVWEQNLASKVCSPVVADGHVYWAWQQVYCLDFETGKLEWKGGACGDPGSCIATADGRLIVWSGRGDLTLVEGAKRSPDRYLELARKTGLSSADVWPHVVLANRRLFCKDREGNILSFALTDG